MGQQQEEIPSVICHYLNHIPMRLWTLESGENIPGHELFSK
jgi:hypothetical protein